VSSLKAELDTTTSGIEKNLIASTVSLCWVAVIILASIAFIDYLLRVSQPGDFLFAALWVFPLAFLNLLLGRIQKRKDFHTFAKAVSPNGTGIGEVPDGQLYFNRALIPLVT
jgi:hypothetical protein